MLTVPRKPTPPPVVRCEACRRPGTRLETRNVAGEYMQLCADPVTCRHHWPALEVSTS